MQKKKRRKNDWFDFVLKNVSWSFKVSSKCCYVASLIWNDFYAKNSLHLTEMLLNTVIFYINYN